MTGVIITLHQSKGFGFVLPDGCTDERRDAHFFHRDDCLGGRFPWLRIRQAVEFDSTVGSRGLRAANVRSIETRACAAEFGG